MLELFTATFGQPRKTHIRAKDVETSPKKLITVKNGEIYFSSPPEHISSHSSTSVALSLAHTHRRTVECHALRLGWGAQWKWIEVETVRNGKFCIFNCRQLQHHWSGMQIARVYKNCIERRRSVYAQAHEPHSACKRIPPRTPHSIGFSVSLLQSLPTLLLVAVFPFVIDFRCTYIAWEHAKR